MLAEIPFAILAAGAVLVGLWISNIMYDLKVPQYISRKIGHIAGGVGFLICAYLFKSAWWPLILSAGFTLILFVARYLKPDTFRGVGGAGRGKDAFSEVWFPLSAAILFAVGWLWLQRPIETVACLLFMAWGDAVTGLVRSQVYHKAVKGVWGSVAMLVTCLIISWSFIHPFWVGALASVMATVVEYISGDVSRLKFMRHIDDNVAIPLIAAAVVLALV